jgi:hypothetical protein
MDKDKIWLIGYHVAMGLIGLLILAVSAIFYVVTEFGMMEWLANNDWVYGFIIAGIGFIGVLAWALKAAEGDEDEREG